MLLYQGTHQSQKYQAAWHFINVAWVENRGKRAARDKTRRMEVARTFEDTRREKYSPTSRAHLYENLIMKIEWVSRYIASRQNKIDRAPTGWSASRPGFSQRTFVRDVRELHSLLLISSFRTTVVGSHLSGTITTTDPFVTKICCDPRRKFALAAKLQEGRVGRNEDLSRPCRKENTSWHVWPRPTGAKTID